MVNTGDIEYFTDPEGNPVGVVVPIAVWREIESEIETAHLLKRRLLEAKDRQQGISLEEAREKLGI